MHILFNFVNMLRHVSGSPWLVQRCELLMFFECRCCRQATHQPEWRYYPSLLRHVLGRQICHSLAEDLAIRQPSLT